jgi:hypothetical protein
MSTRIHQLCLAIGSLMLSSGCAMCCGLYDNDYLATSELLQRTNPSHGRVGSVFSDPQAGASVEWSRDEVQVVPETQPTMWEAVPKTGTPGLAVPQQPTLVPPGGTPTPARLPAQGVSVREDLQSRRPARSSDQTVGSAPRKLTPKPSTPMQSQQRLERQPIRQVSGRR